MNSRNGQYQEAYQFLRKKREEIIGWVRVGVDSACQVELYINAIQELIDLLRGQLRARVLINILLKKIIDFLNPFI